MGSIQAFLNMRVVAFTSRCNPSYVTPLTCVPSQHPAITMFLSCWLLGPTGENGHGDTSLFILMDLTSNNILQFFSILF